MDQVLMLMKIMGDSVQQGQPSESDKTVQYCVAVMVPFTMTIKQ